MPQRRWKCYKRLPLPPPISTANLYELGISYPLPLRHLTTGFSIKDRRENRKHEKMDPASALAAGSLVIQLIDVLKKQMDFLTEAWGVALMQRHRGILWALLLDIMFPAAGK